MIKFILGRKGRMTQVFTASGECVPATLIEAGPNVVTKVCTPERDGYHAFQVGFDPCREKVLSKAEVGHLKKAGVAVHRHLCEFRLPDANGDYQVGKEIKCDIFEVGDMVNVVGWSKGRGFAGAIKRHGFNRQPAGHGGMATRRRGSSGAGSDPGRVFKGKRMAGHLGTTRFTVMNLEVVDVDMDHNVIAVKGAVPGHRRALLEVRPVTSGYPTRKKAKDQKKA